MKTQKINKMIWPFFAAMIFSSTSFGACYSNCDQSQKTDPSKSYVSEVQQSNTNNTQTNANRSNSNNVDGKNSSAVMGNMTVDIGHKNMSIGSVGSYSTINNSINSSIVLGNINQ